MRSILHTNVSQDDHGYDPSTTTSRAASDSEPASTFQYIRSPIWLRYPLPARLPFFLDVISPRATKNYANYFNLSRFKKQLMKIISYNVNGIRAAMKKGFIDWLILEQPDVVCVQEIKALQDQIDIVALEKIGYKYNYWFSAEKKGYSGVGIISRQEPNNVIYGTGISEMDFEGRNLRVDFDQLSIMSLYLPSRGQDKISNKKILISFYNQSIKENEKNLTKPN